jgi:hypothetical protein
MKSILFGAAVAAMLVGAMPSDSEAQTRRFFGLSNGPTLPEFSYVAKRERSFDIFNSLGADDAVPPSARSAIDILNRTVFGATGVSRFSRFFGIRG